MRALVFAFLLAGCGPRVMTVANVVKDEEQQPVWGTFDAGFDRSWEAVVKTATERYGTPAIATKERGLVETAWQTGTSDYVFESERGPLATSRFRMRVTLASSGNRTSVKIVGEEEVLRGGSWIPVPSSGSREIELIEGTHIAMSGIQPKCRGGGGVTHRDYGHCERPGAHAHNHHQFAGNRHVCVATASK